MHPCSCAGVHVWHLCLRLNSCRWYLVRLSLYVVFWSPAFHRAGLCPCLNERFKLFLKLKEYVRPCCRDKAHAGWGGSHVYFEASCWRFIAQNSFFDVLFVSLMNIPEKKTCLISLCILKIILMWPCFITIANYLMKISVLKYKYLTSLTWNGYCGSGCIHMRVHPEPSLALEIMVIDCDVLACAGSSKLFL